MDDLSRAGVSIDSDSWSDSTALSRVRAMRTARRRFATSFVIALCRPLFWLRMAEVVGTVTLIYYHHCRLLPEKLTEIQHQHHAEIISTVHAHLDHDTCLEVVVVKGKSRAIQQLADLLISTKGVQHGRLVMSSPAIGHSSAKHRHK